MCRERESGDEGECGRGGRVKGEREIEESHIKQPPLIRGRSKGSYMAFIFYMHAALEQCITSL